MELMTSRAFFARIETLSPAEVLRLAARPGSTKAGVPPYPAPQHTERDVCCPVELGRGMVAREILARVSASLMKHWRPAPEDVGGLPVAARR